jgi:glycosyltransferase involved in cell wall biosynthesis
MVLVSALMTSYNHERYISQAIESVLTQTFTDLELIIVDDASTDNSPRIIAQYQNKDPRVRAFFHKNNLGIAKTANECQSMANGKFICFIGSDDLWVPHKLEKQVKILSDNEDKVVWSEGAIINSEGISTGLSFSEMHKSKNKPKSGSIYREIFDDNYIFGQSVIFKKEFWIKSGFCDELKFLSDYKFLADLSYRHEFLFIPESLAMYRVHGQNTISREQESWLKDRIFLKKYFLKRYGDNLSNHLKGSLYLKIGEAFYGLGQRDTAKHYYLKALRVDFLSKQSILYLTHTLTSAEGFLHRFLLQFYLKLGS